MLASMPRQWFEITTPLAGVTANTTSANLDTSGVDAALQLEVRESNGGTGTLNVDGSFDGINWYAAGYQQVDNNASLSRAVAAISITANSAHVYQILDPYPVMRLRLSSVANNPNVTARFYKVGS